MIFPYFRVRIIFLDLTLEFSNRTDTCTSFLSKPSSEHSYACLSWRRLRLSFDILILILNYRNVAHKTIDF